ncbi:MAG: phospho-sugar mutase [Verrucomicrobia bacterium]|nr:phospho-sugar mutase [Verrucomicrobiota bacterium]
MNESLLKQIQEAAVNGKLRESSAKNIAAMLGGGTSALYRESVAELVAGGQWGELDDRFFTTLAFGTGGLRGRTIGKIVTRAEQGTPDALGRPEHPCVGTNAMNFYNVRRATIGLCRYLLKWRAQQPANAGSQGGARPKIAVAYDSRHFSRDFAEEVAKAATAHGCDVAVFREPRSTPELSFAVRLTGAQAGIVITASHNPPHDNGYKVYFNDGAQVIEPHASGIIKEVNAVADENAPAPAGTEPGEVQRLGEEVDSAYLERLKTLVLAPELLKGPGGRDLRIVFTPIHGTGGALTLPALAAFGLNVTVVPEQAELDGRFPTVKSPNPENAEALALGMQLADKINADLVIATDPDCDRMGVAVRGDDGKLTLFTGNQIGSLMAWYRAKTYFDQGVLDDANKARGVIIKTFVTTDLQKAIAEHYGLRCVETLTGFKYIGQKLGLYESAVQPAEKRAHYRQLLEHETRALRLASASFYVFGGEESYGYSGADFVRDKDGNGAAIMFAEVAAYAKSRGVTLPALLDEIYAQHGFYLEKNGALTLEGADGAAKIQALLASYDQSPPTEIAGRKVAGATNFAREEIRDVEGQLIPKEKMLMFTLADGGRVAVRGSGTEPKIKYYLFAKRAPEGGRTFSTEELKKIKNEVRELLDKSWDWLQQDANTRLAAAAG